MSVERCPICLGCGNVPGGFYQSLVGHIDGWISANTSETCRACSGSGVIYNYVDNVCYTEGGQNYVFKQETYQDPTPNVDVIKYLQKIEEILLTIERTLKTFPKSV